MEISIDISNFIARQGDQKVGGKITPVLEKVAETGQNIYTKAQFESS
jgi:hypothetical protein